jgi:hypothetical protein
LQRPRLSERTHRTPGASFTPVSSQTADCSESPPTCGRRLVPAPDEDSRWRAPHSSDRRGAALPSKRSKSRTFERNDELSGRRGILVRLCGGHGDEGTAASTARQRRTSFQLRCAPPGCNRCEDLTPGNASLATIRRNERRWLGTGTTAKLLRRRQPRATTRPVRTSAITIACLKEERTTPSKSRQPGEQRRLCLGTTSWNHAFE